MAQAFNLTAQINLQAPSNLKTVVAQIRREFQTVSADVKVNVSPQAARSIDNVTNRLDAMNASLIQARNNTTALDSALRNLSSSLSSVQSTTSKTDNAFSKTSTSVGQTAKNIKVATTEMEEFGKQSALAIRRFAAFSVVTSGVFALINAVNSGFQAFVEFDKELVKLQQVTGRGEIGLKSLEKEISNLSTTLGVSSKSLMSVASTLAQAGLSADETRVALAALAKTELAPSFDNLTDTTEGAIAAIRQFGLEAGDLEKALGSINAVAAAFAVESKDIIAAIQRTGGVFAASSRGVSEGTDALNEFIAVFTSIRQTTRESAETIATGLRTIFTRIQRAKTIDQLKEYGVELTDLEGKFVGPYEAVKRLSAALSQLDPRDLRFSSIVEELGGFRQIGKVIPLIQQFKTAQDALAVAQKGQGSLYDAQVTAQKSLANQLAKVREQFLALIRDVGKSQSFQALFKIVTGLASGLISLASAFKPILPILAIMGAVKGVSAIRQFGSGFMGGISKGGGARGVGSNIGESLSGAKDKERDDTTARASDAIRENTSALKILTDSTNKLNASVLKLDDTIKSRPSTGTGLNSGGIVRKFARGGLVPGSGNGDTVPAMLEPGEFVIRKKAVETLGASSLHKMNRYANGGAVSIQNLKGTGKRGYGKKTISEYQNKNVNIEDDDYISSQGSSIEREKISKYLSVADFASGIKELEPLLNTKDTLLRKQKSYDARIGPLAEELLKKKLGASKYLGLGTSSSNESNAPIDLIGDDNLYEVKLKNESTSDAELYSKLLRYKLEQSPESVLSQFKEAQKEKQDSISLGSIKLLEAQELRKELDATYRPKAAGGIIQKLANGGFPLIDDLPNAKGSMLPRPGISPGSPLDKIIKEGGGAVDFDRTLQRTVGDAAYASAKTASAKDEVLQKYFRDPKARLKDAKQARLTQFGKQLQDLIKQGVIEPSNLSIISKSKRVEGLAEHIQEMFGIPVQNMVFTSGGSKEPALEAMRTKGPRVNRVRKALGGLVQRFAVGGEAEALEQLGRAKLISLAQKAGIPYDYELLGKKSLEQSDRAKKDSFLQQLVDAGIISKNKAARDSTVAASRSLAVVGITGDRSEQEIKTPGASDDKSGLSVRGVPATLETGALPPNVAKRVQAKIRAGIEKMVREVGEQISKASGSIPNLDRKFVRSVASKDIEDIAGSIFEKALGVAGGGYDPMAKAIDFPGGLNEQLAGLLGVSSGVMTDVTNRASKATANRKVADGQFDRGRLEARQRFGRSQFALGGQVYGLQKGTGLKDSEFDALVKYANTNAFTEQEFKDYLALELKRKASKKDLLINSNQLRQVLLSGTTTPQASSSQLDLARQLMGAPDAKFNPKYDNARKPFATGGSVEDTVPALLTPGEFVINKKAAQQIGYSKLNRMNKADKIKGYNKGGPVGVQRFEVGGEVAGVSEKILKSILVEVSAKENNSGGKELINTIKDAIANQALGTKSASEAIVDVAAGIRKLSIEKRASGNEDRAQSLKKIFDRLDELQKSRGGSSLVEATNTRVGIDTAKPTGETAPASETPASGPSPSGPSPSSTSTAKDEVKKRKEEQKEYFAYRAKQSGQTADAFRSTLAAKVVSREKDLAENLKNQQIGFRYSALSQSSSLKGSTDKEQLDAAKEEFAAKLKEMDPSRNAEEIDKAAARLVGSLKKGADSFDTIVEKDTVLSDMLNKTRTSAENAAIAFDDIAKENGLTSDVLREEVSSKNNKQYRQQRFMQSESGQKFGKLAEIAPDAVSRFASSGIGKALSSASDINSKLFGKSLGIFGKTMGKIGESLDKKFQSVGGSLVAFGGGLAVAGDQLPKLIESFGMRDSVAAAGVVGGIQGAGQGLASGALLGGQIAGPVGALIGGVTVAIVKGIEGAFNAINNKKLENTLKALDKTSSDLSVAFKKLDAAATDVNFSNAQSSFQKEVSVANSLRAQANFTGGSELVRMSRAFDFTGVTGALTGQSVEGEAGRSLVTQIGNQLQAAEKLGDVALSQTSTESINSFLDSLVKLPEKRKDQTQEQYNEENKDSIDQRNTQLARASQTYQQLAESGLSEEDIFMDKYIDYAAKQGKTPEDIRKQLSTEEGKKEALNIGKEQLAVDSELALKQQVLARASRELATATDNLIDIYKRAQGGLLRYSQELEKFEADAVMRANSLTGDAKIRSVDRSNENALGNISAYSMAEVEQIANQTASIAGGGDAGDTLKNNIITAKILQDELPKALKGAKDGDVDSIMEKLEKSFDAAGIEMSEQVKTQLREKLQEKIQNRQGNVGLADLAEDMSFVQDATKLTEEALKTGQAIQKAYNDTLQASINLLDQYNSNLDKSDEWNRKVADIRINAELDLARALGQSPTLEQLNDPFNTRVKSLTSGLIPGGSTDPNAINNSMKNSIEQKNIIQARIDENKKKIGMPGENREAINSQIKKDQEALAKHTRAINNGNKALEELANNSEAASNALNAIQDRQQLGDNARGLARRLLTSDSGELADFTRQMGAYTKTISGKASGRELGSLQFRQDAFAGLDNIKSVIPENIAKQMEAKLARSMIEANPQGQQILQSVIGVDAKGNPMTVDQSLKMAEEGKDPVQEQYIEAYRQATEVQAQAAQALADNALLAAEELRMDIESLFAGLETKLAKILETAKTDSEVPRPPVEAQPAPQKPLSTGRSKGKSQPPDESNKDAGAVVGSIFNALVVALGAGVGGLFAVNEVNRFRDRREDRRNKNKEKTPAEADKSKDTPDSDTDSKTKTPDADTDSGRSSRSPRGGGRGFSRKAAKAIPGLGLIFTLMGAFSALGAGYSSESGESADDYGMSGDSALDVLMDIRAILDERLCCCCKEMSDALKKEPQKQPSEMKISPVPPKPDQIKPLENNNIRVEENKPKEALSEAKDQKTEVETRSLGLDVLQGALELGGFIPGIGEFADLANAAISSGRAAMSKDPKNRMDFGIDAGLNAAAAIPFVGYAANATKITKRAIQNPLVEAGANMAVDTAAEIALSPLQQDPVNVPKTMTGKDVSTKEAERIIDKQRADAGEAPLYKGVKQPSTDYEKEYEKWKEAQNDSAMIDLTNPSTSSSPEINTIADMAKQAMTPGSIYTHDTHAEEILNKILVALNEIKQVIESKTSSVGTTERKELTSDSSASSASSLLQTPTQTETPQQSTQTQVSTTSASKPQVYSSTTPKSDTKQPVATNNRTAEQEKAIKDKEKADKEFAEKYRKEKPEYGTTADQIAGGKSSLEAKSARGEKLSEREEFELEQGRTDEYFRRRNNGERDLDYDQMVYARQQRAVAYENKDSSLRAQTSPINATEANVAANGGSPGPQNGLTAPQSAATEASVASATSPQVYGSPTAQLYANKIDKTKKWRTLEKAHGNVESLERAQAEKLGMSYGDFLADKDKIGAFRQTKEYKSAKDKVSSARTDYLAVKDAPTVGDDFDKSGHRKNVGYEQMMASRRDSYLSRFRPEVREKMMTDKDRERYMSAASGPIPTAVPTQQMSQQTGTGPQTQQQNSGATATMITLDPKALEAMTSFNNSFGKYVADLGNITIPNEVKISGNYTVDLKISGAAAIEALDKKIKEIANTLVSGTDFTSALNQLRDETSLATKNAVKSSSSRGTTSSGGSQQGQIA